MCNNRKGLMLKIPQLLEPETYCGLCPRLVNYRRENQKKYPNFVNAPIPSFGDFAAEVLIVGLAPGLKGANKTGRPFTGDYAGDLLYPTLIKSGFAEGIFRAHANDEIILVNCRITNAVRCVPPQNKPTASEVAMCGSFLINEINQMKNLKIVLALGGLAHTAILTTFLERKIFFKFSHGAQHTLSNGLLLADSYHCSRYNTNTGLLTTEMFEAVFEGIKPYLDC